MSSSAENKKILIFKANSKKNVISELKHINKRLPTKFSYNVYSMMGDVNDQTFDENYIYSLPFDIKKEYRIDQGYNGNFSHQNSFSLDFNMKPGEKVFSAREGIVVKVVDQNDKSCLTKDCARYNNQIMILHSDGSFAEYVHLNKNGTAVKVNDSVKKGQLIGYSGGTGWAKGPHLHFSVFKNKMNGERNYIKTKFKTSAHNAGTLLEQGKTYSRTE
jgi:murein DD-endopeptidase MepM/ murein hydrolase activator NlpD